MVLSKRNFVRIVSVFAALLLVMLGCVINSVSKEQALKNEIHTAQLRALDELSEYLADLTVSLQKSRYAGTQDDLVRYAANLKSGAEKAKSCLAGLPMGDTALDRTHLFLSQVGDYSMSLARGDTITEQDFATLGKLRSYADTLTQEVSAIYDDVSSGRYPIEQLSTATDSQNAAAAAPGDTVLLEDSFQGYPRLIYDGPFSDHMLTKTPALIKNKTLVTRERAKAVAAVIAGLDEEALIMGSDEEGDLPSYGFKTDTLAVSITKNGGIPVYMLKDRKINFDEANLTHAFGVTMAKEYLSRIGMSDMKETYFYANEGVLTVNFAYEKDGILYYTDLVKVSVALDDGEVLAFDARGYIMNHTIRSFGDPTLTVSEAADIMSKFLTRQGWRLCVIPTSYQQEMLTYEFRAKGRNSENLLIYINADTGVEENILILLETDEGTLVS